MLIAPAKEYQKTAVTKNCVNIETMTNTQNCRNITRNDTITEEVTGYIHLGQTVKINEESASFRFLHTLTKHRPGLKQTWIK